MTSPDVLVLREKPHGLPGQKYAAALQERLGEVATVQAAQTPAQEREAIATAPIVSGGHFDESLLADADALDYFACMYAGYDHLPLEGMAERDIAVTNAAGVHGPNIAEHVLGSFLAFARRFFQARRQQRNHEWRGFQSRELAGSRVAIVGMGAIGQAITERLQGFDVTTVGVRYTPEKGGPTDEVYGFAEIHQALAGAEYVAIATPLTEQTRGLIGAEELQTLPPSAVLVNVARGPIVETDALVDALRANHLRGAALDVTEPEPLPNDHPLWDFENVFITPHTSGHTPDYYERLADIVAPNVESVLQENSPESLRNRVV
ncbi:D-2-hydroxyacid dehydrogenase [Halorhabdus sp. CBA1104]|uniref:D-2-hydroxyacid dehydrogenase n=1 Tax=unclassified Halorhabdus TaxID=2621901 RepID=UPI0012B1ECC7|nr:MULTISPECIES: D-2-hydroxyacid dehydrogenase [unclassified Halorhabdus]QGN06576.1 D-2-hydroxyacid dehydrogenase [Halorhabdus sp. CBA1104]